MNRYHRRRAQRDREHIAPRRIGMPASRSGRVAAAGAVLISGAAFLAAGSTAASAATTGSAPAGIVLPPTAQAPAPVAPTRLHAVMDGQASLHLQTTIAQAKSSLGTSYAGNWIDNTGSQPVLVVQTTKTVGGSPTSSVLPDVASPVANRVRLQHVKFTEAELTQYLTVLTSYLVAAHRIAGVSLGIESYDNAVVIELAKGTETILPHLESMVPQGAIRVLVGNTKPSTVSVKGWENLNRTDIPPYKAGMSIVDYATTAGCTSGFLLEVNGSYKGVMAGHCGRLTSYVTGGHGRVGKVNLRNFSNTSTGDFSVFPLTTQKTSRNGEILALQQSATSSYVDDVVGRQTTGAQTGSLECQSGSTTNQITCGTILGFRWVKTYTNTTVRDLTCNHAVVTHGDSGGPVYEPIGSNTAEGKAAGIIDAKSTTFYYGTYSCYTPIDRVLQAETATWGYPAYVIKSTGGIS